MFSKIYMKFLFSIISLISILGGSTGKNECVFTNTTNGCVQFTVSSGTGCAWMCSYCANQLGTNNYYFTDGVCSYQEGQGCVGNPIAGKQYTCCAV